MGKKDKKKVKGAVKTAIKTSKNESKRLKKELAAKGEEDMESIIASVLEEERKKNEIKEVVDTVPPSARSGVTLCAHPDKDELYLFGGEYFNGSKTYTYNDLYIYQIKKARWSLLTCPNSPLPRCSHQAVLVPRSQGELWIFGGEFSSPTRSQFHHYADLWVFYVSERRWEQVKTPGGPSPRSGHRMVLCQKQLFVFGGFHESLSGYKYFDDIYSFSLDDRKWTKLHPAGVGPSPRSGCQLAPLPDGRLLVYGGYCREPVKRDVDKGTFHDDSYILHQGRWARVKQTGHQPSPRSGFSLTTLCSGGERAYAFGGVSDVENDETLRSRFYDDLYSLELDKYRWQRLKVRGETEEAASTVQDQPHLEDPEQEEIRSINDGVFTVKIGPSHLPGVSTASASPARRKAFVPHPRMSAALAIKHGQLYLYGGIFEDGDRQMTLSDMYSLNLQKLDEWKILIPLDVKTQEWLESSSEDGDSSDSDDE